MATPRLVDEITTNQERQFAALPELYAQNPLDEDDEDEPAWGSDPFDILAFAQDHQSN